MDPNVHGVIVQMPLDSVNAIDSTVITDSVVPSKDVDGLNTINQGKVAVGDLTSGFLPCTPNGCIELIKRFENILMSQNKLYIPNVSYFFRSGKKIEGSQSVVIGRSKIVGTPAAELLKWHNATVTVCHSKTTNLPQLVSYSYHRVFTVDYITINFAIIYIRKVSAADILVVGIGQPNYVKGDWIKPGAVVIDCGINSIPG